MKTYSNRRFILSGRNLLSATDGIRHRLILLLSCLFIFSMNIHAQNTVSGTVKDGNGEPLLGVSVIVKHGKTTTRTVTDLNGHYQVKAEPNATIEFSFIGFKSVTVPANQKMINVTLHDDNQLLDEVVVVGYGTQKKVNLTGAVSQVTAEILENRSTSSVTQMLQGAMPNVNIQVNTGSPGAGGTISIRGMGSVNSSSPLILVDGIPGSIDQLNPNDIESISVLKDASSAAIYGARAAFGVVLVTTKKAKSGKAKVSYDGYFSWSKPTVSTDFVTSGYDHAYIYDTSYMGQKGFMGAATGYTEEDYKELEARRYDTTEHPDRPWVVTTTESDGRQKYNYYANFDWWNWMYKERMPSQSHNVSISGGTDKIQYYVSANFYSKDGMMKRVDEKYTQYTLTSKFNAEIKSWLRIGNQTNYFDSSHTYPGENAANAAFARTMINCAPYYVPIGPDGNYTGLMKNGKVINEGRVADIYGGVSKGNVGKRRFRNTFSVEITPIKNLSINADYTFGFTMDDNWKRQGLVYISNGYANETQLSTTSTHKKDYIQKSMSYDPSHVFNAYATYGNTFAKVHNVSATIGMNYEKQQTHDLLGYRTDVLSETLNDLNLATGTGASDLKATGGASAYELFGLFFRANYNYKERYLLEVNGRYDGSSRFLSGNRYGFFPSVSAGWRISEEQFMKDLNIFDNLKIRASYGVLGNQLGVSMYPYSTITQKQSSYIVGNSLAYYLTTPAPVAGDYTWEKVGTLNMGIDISVLNNRLNFSGDYFIRKTSDMFVDGITLPAVYGANPPRQNAGEMKTKGYEITVTWHDNFKLAGKPLNYEVFGSLGDATSEITKYQGNDTNILTDYYVGKKIGEIWGYKTGGLFQSDEEATEWTSKIDQSAVNRDILKSQGKWSVARGGDVKFLDKDGNNIINNGANTLDDHGDLEVIGNETPRYNYGFGANINWYGFDFSISFQGIGKRDLYPNKEMEKFWGSWGRVNSAFLPKGIAEQAWSEENKGAYFPRLERGSAAYNDDGQMQVVNDRYLQNLAYLRLKNLSIGYTLPSKLTTKAGIERLRIYFAGENLCYWSPFKTDYIDPEQAMSANDARIYPFSKTVSIGVNLTF